MILPPAYDNSLMVIGSPTMIFQKYEAITFFVHSILNSYVNTYMASYLEIIR